MLEPQGPLPASVYWRRRWTALAGLVSAFALVVISINGLGAAAERANDGNVTTQQIAAAADPQPLQDAGAAPDDERAHPIALSGAAQAGPTPSGDAAVPASGTPAGPAVAPAAGAAPGPAAVPAAGLAAGPAAGPPGVPPAAPAVAGPLPNCPDQALATAAQIAQPQYKVGERPVFRLVIVNNGQTPCRRDLDAAEQEIAVFTADGGKKLWSSNDCFPSRSTDVRVLRPGEPVAFSLTWLARTSSPGCKSARTPLGPGEYRLLSRLGGIISPATQFNLVAP